MKKLTNTEISLRNVMQRLGVILEALKRPAFKDSSGELEYLMYEKTGVENLKKDVIEISEFLSKFNP